MPIAEKTVAQVVGEVSQKMSDPNYTNVVVGSWVQGQRHATHYIKAHVDDIGGAEGVINAVFHANLMATCFQRHGGRSIPQMTFADLNHVSEWDREPELKRRQPALFDYIQANVETVPLQRLLMLLALGMDYVS